MHDVAAANGVATLAHDRELAIMATVAAELAEQLMLEAAGATHTSCSGLQEQEAVVYM